MSAWRTPGGITLQRDARTEGQHLLLGCGRCRICREANARDWALRCHHEYWQHSASSFITLTYAEKYLPPTLQKQHLSGFIKRLRAQWRWLHGPTAQPLRFFGCGEYGGQTARPHYHAILYGLPEHHRGMVEQCWPFGHTRTHEATRESIAYTAGYTAKKIEGAFREPRDFEKTRVSPDGEIYKYQPAFRQMSNRPGIGSHLKQWPASWRAFAVINGYKQRVPRYLHEAWKAQATPEEILQLMREREQLTLNRDISELSLLAAERIAEAKHSMREERRNQL